MKLWIFAVSFILATSSLHASRPELWKEVDQNISKGLPKSAITNLDQIIPSALQDKAYGEAAKAIARKIVLEGNIQGNKPEEKIWRMDSEIAKAPKEIVPLLTTIQAHWYWQYFQQNRWRFMQRTTTAQEPGKDFTTWDLPRLFAQIDTTFAAALSNPQQLQQIPITNFDDLLEKGTVSDIYRPTLYDFIAQEALKFYTSAEQARAKSEDAFEIDADSPILGSVEDFMGWNPQTTQTNSPSLNAIRLYQDLLRFHAKDTNPIAFSDVDLARLVYGYNVAFGENKSSRYTAALKKFITDHRDSEVSSLAYHNLGRQLLQSGDNAAAHDAALQGERAYPDSVGGKMCHNLVAEIESKNALISTERVWNKPLPTIAVRYRNVTQIYFRAVAWDWSDFLEKNHARPEWLNDNDKKELLSRTPALAWSEKLPPTDDFKEKTIQLPAPQTLKPGHYFLVASHDPSFSSKDNVVTYTDIWVSDLALVVIMKGKQVSGFVLDAVSGDPIPKAEVIGWYLGDDGQRKTNGEPQFTDANGAFCFTNSAPRQFLIRARARGQEIASQQEYNTWGENPNVPDNRVIFFTDRSLYRPGQSIQFKGICVHVDTGRNDYDLLTGRKVEFALLDPNGKEVAKQTATSSEFGSFQGTFTAPRDHVMGNYSIQMTSGCNGGVSFNVEEYKRPKFQVEMDVPKVALRLNDSVSVSGKAENYTGAPVDGANVKWRVVREVRWPDWWGIWGWGRFRGGMSSESQEIAHGTALTDQNGAFKLTFLTKPDPKVDEKSEASFNFRIYADVTDAAGETRSTEKVLNIGFVALNARIAIEQWQTVEKPVTLDLHTQTLDGEPQSAQGTVKIYRLKAPDKVIRPPLVNYYVQPQDQENPSDPNNWPLGDVAFEGKWTTDAKGEATVNAKLGVGIFRVELQTQDRFGKRVTARAQTTVLEPSAKKLKIKIPQLVTAPKWEAEPGEQFMALWGTGYDHGRAFIEIEHRGKIVQSYWTSPDATQQQIKQSVTEAMRGGFTIHITQVRENRAYLSSRPVSVPWSNKDLQLTWEHFTSKLQPNQKETWSLVINTPTNHIKSTQPKPSPRPISQTTSNSSTRQNTILPLPKGEGRGEGEGSVANPNLKIAEMVATLYDQSLDAYLPHRWPSGFDFFYRDTAWRSTDFCNVSKQFQHLQGNWTYHYTGPTLRYRQFPNDLVYNYWNYDFARRDGLYTFGGRFGGGGVVAKSESMNRPMGAVMKSAITPTVAPPAPQGQSGWSAGDFDKAKSPSTPKDAENQEASPSIDLSKVSARKNLNETAFFFPQLTSDSNGVVRMTFTMPEALTTWRFMGFAHDKNLRSGYLEDKTVTAKDLMVQPNPPRFLREGDILEFSVKVSNQSAARQQGKVRLTFNTALNDQSADALLGNKTPELSFDIPANESRGFTWRISVPDGCGFLTYKVVGSTGKISDGEEGNLPVLSRRVLVRESLPLPIRGPATKEFKFQKLLDSGDSKTLQNQSLTVQMVSNPAWYAVLALPYLMEYPYECSEQTFNRLYANSLARYIGNSDPKIRRIFDQWKGTPALESPLEKNQDLKSVMIEETPWYQQAQNESQSRHNIGILFDNNRLDEETARTLKKLQEMQLGDGSWPWFPGGPGNDYITLYIMTGFGRLRHLGVNVDAQCALKSLDRLDNWMEENYRRIQKWEHPEDYVPSSLDAFYLYGRSFFLKDKPVPPDNQKALAFFLAQSRKFWLQTGCRQTQGHLALALHRFSANDPANEAVAKDIMRSIKERSVTNEEMGMFWRDTELSWWWYRAPIETQSLMLEAFDEIMGDKAAVEECRVWLLKQKQTQDWKTTKATADAVYALLLRGKDILASDKLVEVTLDGIQVNPDAPKEGQPAVEPGTGFYEKKFAGADIKPAMGEITVKKVDEGVAWGSVHWQYLEDIGKVTPYEGTPLKLKKSIFRRDHTKNGLQLTPVTGPLAVGDELVVRIELRTDRDMEYVHLKDQRGSGTEPVNVISRYKFQDGLAYYESTRDTASHFFIDYLPKGVYVFEYATRIQQAGQYQTGIAEIQCMYAPEFNSHSESLSLQIAAP